MKQSTSCGAVDFRYVFAFHCWWLVLSGCSLGETDKASESVTLPTGEVITNDSYLSVGRDSVRHNTLYFQQTATSSREKLGEIIEEDAQSLSLASAKPVVLQKGNRTALVIGTNVFQRWPRKEGPYWYHGTATPDRTALAFLRSFLPPGDSRLSHASYSTRPIPDVSYVFHDMDLDKNVLITRREFPDATFPEFIVYSALKYGFTWRFDIERTRSENQFKPPADDGSLIDVSVVTYPGGLTPQPETREAALARAGAKEVNAQTMPLTSRSWTTAQWSIAATDGAPRNERVDVLLGFFDPDPEHLSIFWRKHPVLWDEWGHIKYGEWVRAEASGFNGGVARIVFLRVRKAGME